MALFSYIEVALCNLKSFVFNMLLCLSFLSILASHTRPLHTSDLPGFRLDKVDASLRSTNLECRLTSLKVAPMVLRTEDCQDDGEGRDAPDKYALDKGVVWYDLWSLRCYNRRARVFTASWNTTGKSE